MSGPLRSSLASCAARARQNATVRALSEGRASRDAAFPDALINPMTFPNGSRSRAILERSMSSVISVTGSAPDWIKRR